MDGPMDAPRLLEAYGDTLLRLCCLYLGDRDQAEDAVQETFLRTLRAWPRFRGESSEETWLTRIAINVCKNELRSPWRRRRAPAEHLDTLAVEAPEAADDTLVRAVGHLPPKYRALLLPGVERLPDRPAPGPAGVHGDGAPEPGAQDALRATGGLVLWKSLI